MPDVLIQKNRLLIASKLMGSTLVVPLRLTGTDYVSAPFHYILDCLIPDMTEPSLQWLTSPLSIEIHYQHNQTPRFIHGLITKIDAEDELYHYQLHLKPWIALLDLTQNCRIFQNTCILDIISMLCKEKNFHDFSYSGLTQTYAKQTYIVQYNETDLQFLSRLIAQAGIYYYIEATQERHIVQFLDDTRSCPFITLLPCESWHSHDTLSIQRYTHNDYNPDQADCDLTSYYAQPQKNTALYLQHLAHYHYPGHYLDKNTGYAQARITLEAHMTSAHSIRATKEYAPLQAGQRIQKNPHDVDMYFITQCEIEVSEHTYRAEHTAAGQCYHNIFYAVMLTHPFRTLQTNTKPVVNGLHTATVVGPTAQELYVDTQGRVKVQFHWDHSNQHNEHSSCWLRVMQLQAGNHFGSCFIPRIGQAVLVGFENGDIDRPILIGSTYDSLHRPAYTLPQEQSYSGFKTRSTPNGHSGNELTFVDKAGAEHIYLKAQRDYTQTVNHNATQTIEGNLSTAVLNGNYDVNVQNGNIVISASQNLQLKVNESVLALDPSGITLSAASIRITST